MLSYLSKAIRGVVLLSFLVSISACVSTAPTRLAVPTVVESARAETVLVFLPQREVQVDKPDVNAGGGLLGAIIEGIAESTMDKNRQAALSPIRDVVVSFDFEKQYLEMIKSSLPTSIVREDAKLLIVRDVKEFEDQLAALENKNAISISPRYAFDQNFNLLYVDSVVRFGDIGLLRNGKGKVVPKYKSEKEMAGKVTYVIYSAMFPLEDAQSYDKSAAVWSANNGALLIKQLNVALNETQDLLRRDLATPIVANDKLPTASVKFPGAIWLKSYQMESRNGRSLYALGARRFWTTTVQKK
jgi:hypothetical protein